MGDKGRRTQKYIPHVGNKDIGKIKSQLDLIFMRVMRKNDKKCGKVDIRT